MPVQSPPVIEGKSKVPDPTTRQAPSLWVTFGVISISALVLGLILAKLGDASFQKEIGLSSETYEFTKRFLEGATVVFAILTLIDGHIIRRHGEHSIASLDRVQGLLSDEIKDLSAIKDALSTRYIGSFPGYLLQIKHTFRQSRGTIRIMCDFAGHGSFTDPDNWKKIEEELVRALKGKTTGTDAHENRRNGKKVDVRVLHANSSRQRALFLSEYPVIATDETWRLLTSRSDYHSLAELVENFTIGPPLVEGKPLPLSEWNRLEFLDRLDREENEIIERLINTRGKFTRKVTDGSLPFYVWIQDESEAIFAFPTHSEADAPDNRPNVATAFLTRDRNIVNSLILTFDRIMQESS